MVTHDVSSRPGLGLVDAADEEDGEDEEKFDDGERSLVCLATPMIIETAGTNIARCGYGYCRIVLV